MTLSLQKFLSYPVVPLTVPLDRRRWRMPKLRFRNGSKQLRNWDGLYLSQKDGSCSPDALVVQPGQFPESPFFVGDRKCRSFSDRPDQMTARQGKKNTTGIPSDGRCAEWQGETQLAVGIFSMCSTTITSTGIFCDFKRSPKRSRSTFGSPGSPPSVSSCDHFKSKP
jgi:hypothetical protein